LNDRPLDSVGASQTQFPKPSVKLSMEASPLRIIKMLSYVVLFIPILITVFITLALIPAIISPPQVSGDNTAFLKIFVILVPVDAAVLFFLIKLFKSFKISLFQMVFLLSCLSILELVFFVFTLPN